MSVGVIIPYRSSGCEHRRRNFEFVEKTMKRLLPEADHITVDANPDLPFNRGASRNAGVRVSNHHDVIVLVDADTVPQKGPLDEAIWAASQDGKMHLPYTTYRTLTPSGTKKALRGLNPSDQRVVGTLEWACSGVVVMDPDSYAAVGGQLELTGWGFEDSIFAIVGNHRLGRFVRHTGDVNHLWHPIGWTVEDEDYLRNKAIGEAFASAEHDVPRLEELIKEYF